jgi:hypothetical protein
MKEFSEEWSKAEEGKDRNIFLKKLKKTKSEIDRFKGIIKKQQESAEKQDQIIKDNEQRFAKYQERFSEIFKQHLLLKVRSGVLSKEAADEMISRPGYAPSIRWMVSDIDEYVFGMKRSASSAELQVRHGSDKPVINALAILPRLHVSTLSKFNAQTFYNLLYEKG